MIKQFVIRHCPSLVTACLALHRSVSSVKAAPHVPRPGRGAVLRVGRGAVIRFPFTDRWPIWPGRLEGRVITLSRSVINDVSLKSMERQSFD